MPQDILQTVVNLTDQRNIESLEHNLPSSIASLLPVKSISIYKPIIEKDFEKVEEILKFLVQDTTPSYLWSAEPEVLDTSETLKHCFKSSSIQEHSKNNGQSEIYYPITIAGKTIAALRIESPQLDSSQRFILDSLTSIYKNYLTVLNESERDTLTSLLNRRSFDQRFDKLVSLQKHQQRALWEEYEEPEKRHLNTDDKIYLAMMDIDHFKRVNDNYGHIYGDEILLLMATLMRETFRDADLLFRFGGEEFVILLEPTSQKNAHLALERFRKKVESYDFPQVGELTISIGFTAIVDKNYATTACSNADQALYFAKNNGRNCTHSFEQLLSSQAINYPNKVGSVELF